MGSVMQWPAVTIVSGLTNVKLQGEMASPRTLLASTCTIIPTAGATTLRISAGGLTQALFSQSGGLLQNQKVAKSGCTYPAGSRNGSQFVRQSNLASA